MINTAGENCESFTGQRKRISSVYTSQLSSALSQFIAVVAVLPHPDNFP